MTLTEGDKVTCCLNENTNFDCGIYKYQSSNCDSILQTYCQDKLYIPKCSCVKGAIAGDYMPACLNMDCTNHGVKLSGQDKPCNVEYIDCKIALNLAGKANINTATITQICGQSPGTNGGDGGDSGDGNGTDEKWYKDPWAIMAMSLGGLLLFVVFSTMIYMLIR